MRFDDGEHVLYVIRQHWIVFAGYTILIAFAAIAPLFILRAMPDAVYSLMPATVLGPYVALLYFLWLLFLWVSLFSRWTLYYLNAWIVTDRRIIDIHQRGLFSRTLDTALLEKVQDVSIDTDGLFQTLFRYGTVTIHTAGDEVNFVIKNAAHPEKARKNIMDAHAAALERPYASKDL